MATQIIVKAEIYPGTSWGAKRQKVRAEFNNVQEYNMSVDFKGIRDNVGAGSIDRITEKEIKSVKGTFREYTFRLFGGNRRSINKIKIVSSKVKITAL